MESGPRRWLTVALLLPALALASASSHPVISQAKPMQCSMAEGSTAATPQCCKVCKKGKACGDSCIARDKVCHQPPGCACNG